MKIERIDIINKYELKTRLKSVSTFSSPTKSRLSSSLSSERFETESTSESYADPAWFLSGDGDCDNQIE